MPKHAVTKAPQGQEPAVERASEGVEVCVQGWKPGLNKVRLTKAFRDGGNRLSAASDLTGDVLNGREVRVCLSQFDSPAEARDALARIGVERVWQPE